MQELERGKTEPGTTFVYNNWDFNVAGTVFEMKVRKSIYDVFDKEIARPLQLQDWNRGMHRRTGDSNASIHLAYHFHFSTRDMARIGQLMLRKGQWNGKQVISADWVSESTRPFTKFPQGGGYGYIWGDKRTSRIEGGSTEDTMKLIGTNKNDTFMYPADPRDTKLRRPFAPAGQSTQMIIGATNETDLELIRTTQSLYQSFDLKRVFYSGYIPLNEDSALPSLGTPVPLLREHRLYQADWLLRYYGFYADELLDESNPFFDNKIDPKCNWALRNLDIFPVEINAAPADVLLRVPGIGPTGVQKILAARRYTSINFQMLKRMHITLKRAQYFITCNGKMLHRIPFDQLFIRKALVDMDSIEVMKIGGEDVQYKQLNFFSDFGMEVV